MTEHLPCPPIPEFLIRRGPIDKAFSLPADHPVHLAAVEQRRRREQATPAHKRVIAAPRKIEWVVYRVAAVGGRRKRIGKIVAPHDLAALKAAQRRWPAEVDTTRPQGGLAVEPRIAA